MKRAEKGRQQNMGKIKCEASWKLRERTASPWKGDTNSDGLMRGWGLLAGLATPPSGWIIRRGSVDDPLEPDYSEASLIKWPF